MNYYLMTDNDNDIAELKKIELLRWLVVALYDS
jgi:hypothetical protein